MGVTVRLGGKATEVSPLTPDSSSSPKRRSLASRSITAFSNFGVQYNYNAIAWAKLWIEALYGDPAWADQLSSSAVFGGTLIGAALRHPHTPPSARVPTRACAHATPFGHQVCWGWDIWATPSAVDRPWWSR